VQILFAERNGPPYVVQMSQPKRQQSEAPQVRARLGRALSKLGFCSRAQAYELIRGGRVQVNGAVQRDPERAVDLKRDCIVIDGKTVRAQEKIYLMLNKPRGLVTTTSDEQGRETVYECLKGLPRLVPVGRLDKASEGLLLFTNDTQWADGITAPETHLEKTYHVQINCLADEGLVGKLTAGVSSKEGDFLAAKRARVLREGVKNSWLEIVLDEGKNRHIRRLLECLGIEVLRLMRVSIGTLELGALEKGKFRYLTAEEVVGLVFSNR
jgi:23S rRNA pseudouridine2605 synthase